MVVACSSKGSHREGVRIAKGQYPEGIENIQWKEVYPSFFTLYETETGRVIDGAASSVEVIEDGFWISAEPITPAVYEGVMGKGRWPKSGLSLKDAEIFCDVIYKKMGLPVVVPTETMFESAVNSGVISLKKHDEIVVRPRQRDHDVYKIQTGIQDANSVADSRAILRTLYTRGPIEVFRRRAANRFYLAIRTTESRREEFQKLLDYRAQESHELSDGQDEVFEVNGCQFKMVAVEGGSLLLGATPEQERYAETDENPVHESAITGFKISDSEVTIGLWSAVMGNLPFGNTASTPNVAVGNISWYDAMEFVSRLNEMTGRHFRLPSEDEWEYAARGGVKTHNYIFAGSNNTQDYVVCAYKEKKKDESVLPSMVNVKSKKPNELGLYDMSGNQWEWVRGSYQEGKAVQKGGSRRSLNVACRVSNRQAMSPDSKKDTFGFRVVL